MNTPVDMHETELVFLLKTAFPKLSQQSNIHTYLEFEEFLVENRFVFLFSSLNFSCLLRKLFQFILNFMRKSDG